MSKYYNKITVTGDGIRHDSQKEANRWEELKLLQRAGKIKNLQRQVKFELTPKLADFRASYYIADFVYEDLASGKTVVEDCKGMRTDVYKLKKKMLFWRYGIRILET